MAESTIPAQPVEHYPSSDAWVVENGRTYLVGGRCPGCEKIVFPRRPWCDACDSTAAMVPVRLSPTGTIYSFSEIHVAPAVFTTPYVVGYIDFPESVRVFGQIDGRAAELSVGDTVEVVTGPIRTTVSGTPVVSYRFRKSGGPRNA